ncbi:MAG: ferredoxin family protein [Solirubrobacterales bacterium]|nr:ferredoxin family protein [Solirubrobacterales bacterium]
MIELVSAERCIKCDVCIRVCPTNVFDHGEDRLPVIKHQDACQTCFMCEAWCPTDALFVAPQATPVADGSRYRDENWLIAQNLLGSYRRELGWGQGRSALEADGRLAPEREGMRMLSVPPLGAEHRRAAEGHQYDIGFSVAYSDEGEEVEEEPVIPGLDAG